MIIPNAEHAIVDLRKLRDYVLNPEHDRGKHKARVFASVFGLTANDAETLRVYLLEIAQTHEAQSATEGSYGQIYRIDLPFTWNGVTENVRVTWIIRHDEDYPRLVSCFVRLKGR